MKTSEQEVFALVLKAARGAGFPAGNAEDIARAAAWLSLRRYGGVEAALATTPSAPAEIGDGDPGRVEGGSAGLHGPGLIDLLIADPGPSVLQLGRFDSPLLLFGLCGVAAADRPVRFTITTGDGRAHELDGDGCRPDPPSAAAALGQLTIGCRTGPAAARSRPSPEIEVPDPVWQAAEALATKTYVPSSERSRRLGAGAGLTDND